MSKKSTNIIPTRALPKDAIRITKEDKTRVWLIGGREFESKRAYFQFLRDVALASQIGKDTAADTTQEGFTGAPAEPVKSAADG